MCITILCIIFNKCNKEKILKVRLNVFFKSHVLLFHYISKVFDFKT